ncbi:TPA: hypothetical protein SMN50_002100 [Proteus mirabilis]|nr:hypothetical protein [Proteus mirabilis]
MLKEYLPPAILFATIPLDKLVPEDDLIHKVDTIMDFEFIYDVVAYTE